MNWPLFLVIAVPSLTALYLGYLYGFDAGRRARDERSNTDA